MVEERVIIDMQESIVRDRHLVESRVDLTRLSLVGRGRGKGRRRREGRRKEEGRGTRQEPGAAVRRSKLQRGGLR